MNIRLTDDPVLVVDHVSRRFGDGTTAVAALDDVSLEVAAGSVCALTGPSGSGKSTLLHLAAGLLAPTAGTVRVGGRDVSRLDRAAAARLRRDTVGVVFQRANLVPTLTAAENVVLPLEYGGCTGREARRLAEAALERVGLPRRGGAWPDDLSGGEQQRVAIARAIAVPRAVVLADEPTGALDTTTGDGILSLLVELATDGAAVLVVSHDPRVASYADRVVGLRDGRLVHDTDAPGDLALVTATGRS